jgi:hypothetical protein
VRKAHAAQELLNNPLLNESLFSVESDLLAQMRAVKLDDVNAHTRLIMALQINSTVQRTLWSRIQDGHRAGDEINLRGKRLD